MEIYHLVPTVDDKKTLCRGIRPKDQKLWIMVYSDTRMQKLKNYGLL